MGAWVSVQIEDDPSQRLLIARCLKCREMVVAGKERKMVEAAALHHHCWKNFGRVERPNLSAWPDSTGLPRLMFIEPLELPTECVVDALTRKGAALLRRAHLGTAWLGYHVCVCGAQSGACDLVVQISGKSMVTNSLLVHYLAYHRKDIPADQLALFAWANDEADPTPYDLVGFGRESLRMARMSANAMPVKLGTWLYGDMVLTGVRIVESPIAFGTGDAEDPPEVRDDKPMRCFYVEWAVAGTGGDWRSAGHGPFYSLDDAESYVAAESNGTVKWQ